MKSKIYNFLIFLILSNIFFLDAYSQNQFNFNVTNVEVLQNGNIYKGNERGEFTTNNGIIINANSFEYNKALNILYAKGNVKIEDIIKNYVIFTEDITYYKNEEKILSRGKTNSIIESKYKLISNEILEYDKALNILNAKGDVEIEDTINNYIILAEDITYFKNEEKILTRGKTKSKIKSKYELTSENVLYLVTENKLKSSKKSTFKDNNSNVYILDKFNYSINKEELKGENIIAITNFDKPESDKFYFSNGIINFKTENFIAKDTKIEIHNDIFGNADNNPRLKGVSSNKSNNIITVNKGVFTSCKERDDCPPWMITAKKIKHDKNKKQIIYDNAILKVYNIPVLYFPKFFHPDPTVDRQSGFLRPQLNNSSILGNSLTVPYFYVSSIDKDFTFTPTIFDKNVQMFQTEFRKINKDSNLIADIAYTRSYTSTETNEKNNISHFFGNYDLDLNLSEFESSKLTINFEKTSNDTYLKVFDTYITESYIRPENFDVLNSELKLELNHENFDLSGGFHAYENLQLTNNDRYHYVLPYYNLSKTLSTNFVNGSINFMSNGTNELKNTNNLRSKVTNDFTYRGFDIITDSGFKNNFNINLKNLNSIGKNDTEYKTSPQVELMSDFEITSSLPLIKENNSNKNFFTPKLSFRFNPSDMKNYSSSERKINISNIFSNNRLGLDDSFESGRSLTLGIDYRTEDLDDINKFFEFKMATVFRDKEENLLPKVSTLNRKNSNLFGSISSNYFDYLNLNYNFSIDNDLNSFEYNEVQANISVNNLLTSFNFIEESGEIGDANVIENRTRYEIDENNYLSFNTRRNRKLNLTEYYDLVYEYKNDCLTAGIKYKKTYYQDRDLKPSENLFFTLTLIPLTTYEHKIDR